MKGEQKNDISVEILNVQGLQFVSTGRKTILCGQKRSDQSSKLWSVFLEYERYDCGRMADQDNKNCASTIQ